MPYFGQQTASVDLYTLELVCLHVVKCRMFRNQTIPLNPNFDFKYEQGKTLPVLTITRNQNHIDLFAEDRLNLIVLCGQNGAGKTSIIQILQAIPNHTNAEYIVVLKDNQGAFLATRPITVIYEGQEKQLTEIDGRDYKPRSVACANTAINGEEELNIHKKIHIPYLKYQALFDFPPHPLFNHFQIEPWKFDDNADAIASHLKDTIGLEVKGHDIMKMANARPELYLLAEACQYSTFDELQKGLKTATTNTRRNLVEMLEHLLGSHQNAAKQRGRQLSQLIHAHTKGKRESKVSYETQPKVYRLAQCETVVQKVSATVQSIWKEIEAALSDTQIDGGLCQRLYYPRMFWQHRDSHGGRKRFLEDLSSGEFSQVHLKYKLLPSMVQQGVCWIAADEPDLHYHPEWKRTFLKEYLKAIRETRDYIAKREGDGIHYQQKVYSIVLTTHSPFILSDVPNTQVVQLEREDNGLTTVRRMDQKTFAGNIGQMFYDNFFMTETIGALASEQLKGWLAELDKPVSEERRRQLEDRFNLVADDILRSLLLDRLQK